MAVSQKQIDEIETELAVTRQRLADIEEMIRKLVAAIGTQGIVVE